MLLKFFIVKTVGLAYLWMNDCKVYLMLEDVDNFKCKLGKDIEAKSSVGLLPRHYNKNNIDI